MKRIILLGAFISTCIVLMASSASAVEYRAVIEHNTNEIISEIGNGKINNIPEEWISTIQKMKLNFNNLKITNDIKVLLEKLTELKSASNNTPQPTCIRLILKFIRLIFCVMRHIFRIPLTILTLIIKIITAPIRLLIKLITAPIRLLIKLITAPIRLLVKIIAFITHLIKSLLHLPKTTY